MNDNPTSRPIAKGTPAAQQAVAEMNGLLGYDLTTVLGDDMWAVRMVDGEPAVTASMDGLRAIARFAPRPDASEVAEDMIQTIEQHFAGGAG